jgi:hypothetical protein
MLQLNISTLFNSYTTYENCINIFYIISKYKLRPFNVLISVLCIYAVAYYINKITNSDTIIVIPPFFKYQSIPFSYGISIFLSWLISITFLPFFFIVTLFFHLSPCLIFHLQQFLSLSLQIRQSLITLQQPQTQTLVLFTIQITLQLSLFTYW